MKKNFILMAFLLVLLSTTVVAGFVRSAAEETTYIRADGSVDPDISPISSADNITYTFTSNINDGIVVERSNIIVDGAGYTLQIIGFMSNGITLSTVNNVTIKNTNIKGFQMTGIWVNMGSNNNIITNNITANEAVGIGLSDSSNNNISGNNITNNGAAGINVGGPASTNNNITANNIANNDNGIVLDQASHNNNIMANNITANESNGIVSQTSNNNNIIANNIANNDNGIVLTLSSNNMIYHNNFIDNGQQVSIVALSSVWDDGSKGNYWSDYESRYPNATEVDGSGIWDTPYVIDESNQDNYPIIPEFPTWTSTLLALILLAVVITAYKRRLLKTPIH